MVAPDLQTVAVTKMGTVEQAGGQRFANPCPPARPAFSTGHFGPLIWQAVNLTSCQQHPYKVCFRSIAAYVRTERGRLPRTHVRSKTPEFSFYGGHVLQPFGVRSGCTRASMPTKPRTRRPEELMILLVCSRLYLRWLAISASLNPRDLMAFRLFYSHHIL